MYLDLDTLDYPLSASDIRARHPLMSFPEPFEPSARYVAPLPTTPPAHDRLTHAVQEAVPTLTNGAYRQSWSVRALTPEESAARVAAVRQALRAAATDARWRAETGGIVVPGGGRVKTGIDDQNRVNSVLANAERAGIQTVHFKGEGDAWVTLPIAALEQIAVLMALHVQACFDAESRHHAAIDALPAADLDAYDVKTGWPGAASA